MPEDTVWDTSSWSLFTHPRGACRPYLSDLGERAPAPVLTEDRNTGQTARLGGLADTHRCLGTLDKGRRHDSSTFDPSHHERLPWSAHTIHVHVFAVLRAWPSLKSPDHPCHGRDIVIRLYFSLSQRRRRRRAAFRQTALRTTLRLHEPVRIPRHSPQHFSAYRFSPTAIRRLALFQPPNSHCQEHDHSRAFAFRAIVGQDYRLYAPMIRSAPRWQHASAPCHRARRATRAAGIVVSTCLTDHS